MIVPENNNLNQDELNENNLNNLNEDNLEGNDLDQEEGRENRADRKTIYKETPDPINEDKPDYGDTSSIKQGGRTDLINRPHRDNPPLGSGHEPGTMPGGNNL